MPLTGQAKTDYQREYMRKRRAGSNAGVTQVIEDIGVKDEVLKAEGITDKALLVSKGSIPIQQMYITDDWQAAVDNKPKPKTFQEDAMDILEGKASKPKRGKDIKCFADLPPDVQQTIDSLSMVDGKICKTVKANRTAIAINYQHLFPDRFHSTGVAV